MPSTIPPSTATPAAALAASDPFDLPLQRMFTYRLHMLGKLTEPWSQQAYVQETGLSLSDGRCLMAIGSFAPLSVKDLAQLSNLNKSQASRAAQALVDRGLVSKTDSAADGRGVVLALTPQGQALCQAAEALVLRRNQEIFGCLSAPELQQFSALLDRLIAHNSRA